MLRRPLESGLGPVVTVMDGAAPVRRRTTAASRAAVTSSARMWVAMHQPTTRRLQASTIEAR